MSFRFEADERADDGLRRIVHEQVDKAIAELEDRGVEPHEAVHQARKRCKKIRAAVRLVRGAFGGRYKAENARYRDLQRRLSDVRDAEALIEAFDKLMERFQAQVVPRAFRSIRDELVDRKRRIAEEVVDLDARRREVLDELECARERVDEWSLDERGFEAFEKGLKKTYDRARKAMKIAYRKPSSENFHEWRKRVKYHWYHIRLLQNLWPELMKPRRDALSELSDLLGDDHDLAILRATLLDTPLLFGPDRHLQIVLGALDRRRAELQHEAELLGRRLFVESGKRLVKRLGTWWDVWCLEDSSDPALAEQVVPPGS